MLITGETEELNFRPPLRFNSLFLEFIDEMVYFYSFVSEQRSKIHVFIKNLKRFVMPSLGGRSCLKNNKKMDHPAPQRKNLLPKFRLLLFLPFCKVVIKGVVFFFLR